jgi:hypothetical protein
MFSIDIEIIRSIVNPGRVKAPPVKQVTQYSTLAAPLAFDPKLLTVCPAASRNSPSGIPQL